MENLNQNNMRRPSPHDLFSGLYPLEIALIKDTFCDDFFFDWETIGQTLKKGDLDIMDEEPVTNNTSPDQCQTMPWGPSSDLNSSVVSDPSSSFQSVFLVNGDKGVDSGKEAPSWRNDLSEGNGGELGEGLTSGATHKKSLKRKRKVILGRNVLLIDCNLRHNLTAIGSFKFLHQKSLPVVVVQRQETSLTDIEVDKSDIQPEAPLHDTFEPITHAKEIPKPEHHFPVVSDLDDPLSEQVSKQDVNFRMGYSK